MRFDGSVVRVHYKDRASEIELNFAEYNDADREMKTTSLALDLQAALNLTTPPVGLRLRVPPGTEAVVCPLSVLIACPSYIATNFQGMSWLPLVEWGGDKNTENEDAPIATTATATQPPDPSVREPLLPPPLGSPLEHDLSFLAGCPSTGSPSGPSNRPLTAPAGDGPRGTRSQPGKEGFGRPMSATPSDKSCGMRRLRPGKSEGFGRPITALPSDHSGSGSPAWGLGSPHGFQCEDGAQQEATTASAVRRPSTAPAFAAYGLRRQSSSNLSGSQKRVGGSGERLRPGRDPEAGEIGVGEVQRDRSGAAPVRTGGGGADGCMGASGGEWHPSEPPAECWV